MRGACARTVTENLDLSLYQLGVQADKMSLEYLFR